MKDIKMSMTEFISKHGANSLTEIFNDERIKDFVALLNMHIEDGRDNLEFMQDAHDFRYIQGQINAMRTVIDLMDICCEVSRELTENPPPNEAATKEDADDERGLEPEPYI